MSKKEFILKIRRLASKEYKFLSSKEYWDGHVNNHDFSIIIGETSIYLRPKKKCVKEGIEVKE